MRLHQTDIFSVAILCLSRARGLRRLRRSFNFGDCSDFAFYRWDVRSCPNVYPPSPRIRFQMEISLEHGPSNTLHVHRSVEHVILVLLPHTPTDRCRTVSPHLVDAISPHALMQCRTRRVMDRIMMYTVGIVIPYLPLYHCPHVVLQRLG